MISLKHRLKQFFDSLTNGFMFFLTIAIMVIMGLSLWWNVHYQQQQAMAELREKAAIIGVQFQAMRSFIAQNQDRINMDSQGNMEFKHLNPAAVGKGVGDIFSDWTDYSIKQTKPLVRNAANEPDIFEQEMMKKLQENRELTEIWSREKINGKMYFRYLLPMEMHSWCLDCHGGPVGTIDMAGYPKEGYELGDFGGAISIAVPMDSFYARLRTTTMHHLLMTTLLLVATLLITFGAMKWMVANPLMRLRQLTKAMGKGNLTVDMSSLKAYGEIKYLARDFDVMAEKLKEMYSQLEQKVADRTEALTKANGQLQEQKQVLFQVNQELFKANKLQSEFLANMSHELRTPLTAIIAFTELLYDEAVENNQVQQAENLQDISEAAYQLLQLINDLLDMAKIEADMMTVKFTDVDLAHVAQKVVKVLNPLVRKKAITIENQIGWDLPGVQGDPQRLYQIMMNLVGNAVKFTPDGGKISLGAAIADQDNKVICWVEDNGMGISEGEQQFIFDRFRQVDSSGARTHAGTGLGLALVKHLVELHGGQVWVESKLAVGSKFYFTLKQSR